MNVIFNDRRVFVLPVIIACNCAGANVGFFANRRVAKISQMHALGTAANAGLFHFYEIPDDGALPESRMIRIWVLESQLDEARTIAKRALSGDDAI